jgi:hypothetical protein
MIVHALLGLSVVGLASSTIYLILVLEAARRFGQSSRKLVGGAVLPPVTVLKPVLRQNPVHKITLIHPSNADTVICSC